MSRTTAAAPARRLENLGQVVGTAWPDGRHLALVGPARVPSAARGEVRSDSVAADAGRRVAVRRGGITRRGRWVLTVVGALLLACVFVLGRSTTSSAAETAPATTVVTPGQTLWSIATQLDPHGDPRRTVHALQTLNHLSPGDALVPGQVLVVPAR